MCSDSFSATYSTWRRHAALQTKNVHGAFQHTLHPVVVGLLGTTSHRLFTRGFPTSRSARTIERVGLMRWRLASPSSSSTCSSLLTMDVCASFDCSITNLRGVLSNSKTTHRHHPHRHQPHRHQPHRHQPHRHHHPNGSNSTKLTHISATLQIVNSLFLLTPWCRFNTSHCIIKQAPCRGRHGKRATKLHNTHTDLQVHVKQSHLMKRESVSQHMHLFQHPHHSFNVRPPFTNGTAVNHLLLAEASILLRRWLDQLLSWPKGFSKCGGALVVQKGPLLAKMVLDSLGNEDISICGGTYVCLQESGTR